MRARAQGGSILSGDTGPDIVVHRLANVVWEPRPVHWQGRRCHRRSCPPSPSHSHQYQQRKLATTAAPGLARQLGSILERGQASVLLLQHANRIHRVGAPRHRHYRCRQAFSGLCHSFANGHGAVDRGYNLQWFCPTLGRSMHAPPPHSNTHTHSPTRIHVNTVWFSASSANSPMSGPHSPCTCMLFTPV